MKYPPTTLIQENNFHNAWARAVRYVLRDGKQITIGDKSEPKPIRDACVLFELTGNAIRQIEDHELHPQFPFRLVNEYCEEFTSEFQKKYLNAEDGTLKFSYTYYDRLTYRSDVNQLDALKDGLKNQIKSNISSNRNQGTTWIPRIDAGHPASPCLQRIVIRYLGGDDADVHLTWRSRDLYTAWQVNIIAIIDMLNREVIRPNECRIAKIVDYSDSLHIYRSDIKEAEKIKLVPKNPQGD